MEAISKIDPKKTSVSTVFPIDTWLLSGTTKKSDNLKVPILSCYEKRCHSIICGALIFCWHLTPTKNGRLQGAHYQLLWREVFFCSLLCQGLYWHPTPPEIGRLQGALPELQCKEALLHCLSCLDLCWHPTPPAIGQLQDSHSELL